MQWTSIKDGLPEPLQPVLATYETERGGRDTIIGIYVPDKHEECMHSDECCCQYDEDDDAYYVPEGWYEQQRNWEAYACNHRP